MNTGIYGIKCLTNNKWYIGSSIRISNRITSHVKELRNNCHINLNLQEDFNKYGEKNFETVIFISNLPEDDIILEEKENYYILLYKSNIYGYNTFLSNRNTPMKNLETRKKQSKSMIGKNSNITIEICLNIKKEILKYNKNTKQKIIEKEIADKFKISTRTVGRIIRGQYRLSQNIGGSLKDWRKGNA